MPLTDLDILLNPVSAEAPCGADLEGRGRRGLSRARAAWARASRSNRSVTRSFRRRIPTGNCCRRGPSSCSGDRRTCGRPSSSPDRLVRTDGWAGFAKGAEILRGLVERYWDGLYPLLDPEDDNDPQMRLSIVKALIAPSSLTALRKTPLITSKTLGKFSLKDIEIAGGEVPPDKGVTPTTMASIDGAARDCDLESLDQIDHRREGQLGPRPRSSGRAGRAHRRGRCRQRVWRPGGAAEESRRVPVAAVGGAQARRRSSRRRRSP